MLSFWIWRLQHKEEKLWNTKAKNVKNKEMESFGAEERAYREVCKEGFQMKHKP